MLRLDSAITNVITNTYSTPLYFWPYVILTLGAAQGLNEDELYQETLAFNSFWFPHNYIQTALYFKATKDTDWNDVDPKVVMGKDFSAISGWYANVDAEVKRLGLVPQQEGGAGCGV